MDKELNKIVNLLRFTLLFRNDLYQSPDYIIEKYDYFIGFQPTVEYEFYTPDNMETFFLKYYKKWKVDDTKKINMILRYLYTLSFSDNENIIQLMTEKFREYIGGLESITSEPKRLHTNLESVLTIIISNKLKELTPILRDLKLKSIGV